MESRFTSVENNHAVEKSEDVRRRSYPACEDSTDFEGECWQQLEEFWGAEKNRFQHELSYFTSTTERQLKFENSLSKPPTSHYIRKSNKAVNKQNDFCYLVRGEEINDIPTTYIVNGLQAHEFPVIGTYIDKRVIPGFCYKVRINRTQRYQFKGRALRLVSIGRGYGKRITFEGDSLLDNDNYFYSDTISQGYGFSVQAISVGDNLSVREANTDENCGKLTITEICKEQVEKATVIENGVVEKQVQLDFYAKFTSASNGLLQLQVPWGKVRVNGVAFLVRPKHSNEAYLDRIVLKNCCLVGFELVSDIARE